MTLKLVLMDLDGTVYRGNSIIEGALQTIDFIRHNNLKLLFFTNNSEKTRKEICKKLNSMGIYCEENEVVCSGYIAAKFISRMNLGTVYVCGTESLKQELQSASIPLVDDNPDTLIIGMDSMFDMDKLKKVLNHAHSAKTIIACNKERTFPCDKQHVCPGCGAIVSSIEHCLERKSDFIIGKPNTIMMDQISLDTACTNEEILVIGDTYESDILMAKKFGSPYIHIGGTNGECTVPSILDVPRYLKKNLFV